VKYTGIKTAGDKMQALFENFPKIVLAVMGVSGLDIASFPGYYAVLVQYAAIITVIFAVYLGNSALSRELADKTYEFIFTKPRRRAEILFPKLLAGCLYLTLYCVLFFIFALTSSAKLGLADGMAGVFAKTALALWLSGMIFFSSGALFASVSRSIENGAKAGNLSVLASYILCVVYDMLEHNAPLRPFLPLRYFPPSELATGLFDWRYLILSLIITAAALAGTFYFFEKKDLQAL
jgi:ABC-2 type transport system permease protein